MKPAVASLLLALLGTGCAGAAPVSVYKCLDAQGRLSYQQSPCAVRDHAELLSVEGELDEARRAEAAARVERRRQAPPPAAPERPAVAAAPPPPTPPPVRCPATRENPGPNPVVVTDAASMAIARAIHQELPSEAWLKSSGRWPKGCRR